MTSPHSSATTPPPRHTKRSDPSRPKPTAHGGHNRPLIGFNSEQVIGALDERIARIDARLGGSAGEERTAIAARKQRQDRRDTLLSVRGVTSELHRPSNSLKVSSTPQRKRSNEPSPPTPISRHSRRPPGAQTKHRSARTPRRTGPPAASPRRRRKSADSNNCSPSSALSPHSLQTYNRNNWLFSRRPPRASVPWICTRSTPAADTFGERPRTPQ